MLSRGSAVSIKVLAAIALAIAVLTQGLGSPAAQSSITASAASVNVVFNSTLPGTLKNGHAGLYGWGTATMSDGTVIVGDIWNHTVVHFDLAGANLGTLFTLTGGAAPYGLAVDKRNDTIYVGINQCCEVERWALSGGHYVQETPITNKVFKYPSRVAVTDDGYVYIVDMLANAIFVYDSNGVFQFSFGGHGTGPGQFKQPRGAAFDGSSPQRLYIMDSFNFRIEVFTRAGAFLFAFGSKGTGPGQFVDDNTRGLAIDRANSWLYAVDDDNNLVQKYDLSGAFLLNIGGTGGRSATSCCATPPGLFSDGGREDTVDGNGNLWVGDMPNFRVQVFSPTGQMVMMVPSTPQLPLVGAFNYPEGVAVDLNGNVIVDDSRNFRIQKFSPAGTFMWQIGLRGRFSGYAFNYAQNIATDPNDGSIVVADDYNNVIKKFDTNGVFLWKVGTSNCGNAVDQFCHPVGVAVGPDGRVYVADTHNQRIVELDSKGTWQSSFANTAIKDPRGLAVDAANGDLYVANFIAANIAVFTNSGTYLRAISGKGTTASTFQHPWDVVVDSTYVYATDNSLNQVKLFNKSDGSFVAAFGGSGRNPGQLRGPEGISLGKNGTVYVADTFNDRIQSWCVTCAGATSPSYVRTIGAAGQVQLYPSGLDVDASGNVAIADTGNDRVQFFQAGAASPSWSVGVRGLTVGAGTNTFENPRDVAMDGRYVFVADTDNQLVQVLNKTNGNYVQSFNFKFSAPYGVRVGTDGSGNERVLVADGGNGNIEVFDATFAHVLTIPPTTANEATREAATDSAGNIYAADYRNDRIDKYSPSGALLSQWGGTGAPTCQQIPKPFGVAIDGADHIYVASSSTQVVKEFNADGSCSATFGQKGSGAQQLFQLRRVAVGPGPNFLVYAADLWGLKVLVYNQDGTISSTQPELGDGVLPGAGFLNEAHGVAVTGSFVYVTDTVNQRLQRFNLDGSAAIAWTMGTPESTTGFNWEQGVAVDPQSGDVWVVNTRNNRIDEFGPSGDGPLRSVSAGAGGISLNSPTSIAFDQVGNMYVADTNNNDIVSLSVPATGSPLLRWAVGTSGSGVGQFAHPGAVVYDGTQAQPRLLVADTNNSRVVVLDPASGSWGGVLGILKGSQPGQVSSPQGLAVSPSGMIWVADTGNDRIEEFNSDGSFANELVGAFGSSNSQFNQPQGIEVGPDGLLYVADSSNNRIQVYQPV